MGVLCLVFAAELSVLFSHLAGKERASCLQCVIVEFSDHTHLLLLLIVYLLKLQIVIMVCRYAQAMDMTWI